MMSEILKFATFKFNEIYENYEIFKNYKDININFYEFDMNYINTLDENKVNKIIDIIGRNKWNSNFNNFYFCDWIIYYKSLLKGFINFNDETFLYFFSKLQLNEYNNEIKDIFIEIKNKYNDKLNNKKFINIYVYLMDKENIIKYKDSFDKNEIKLMTNYIKNIKYIEWLLNTLDDKINYDYINSNNPILYKSFDNKNYDLQDTNSYHNLITKYKNVFKIKTNYWLSILLKTLDYRIFGCIYLNYKNIIDNSLNEKINYYHYYTNKDEYNYLFKNKNNEMIKFKYVITEFNKRYIMFSLDHYDLVHYLLPFLQLLPHNNCNINKIDELQNELNLLFKNNYNFYQKYF